MDRKKQNSDPYPATSKSTDSKTSSSNQPAPQGKRFDETFKLDAVQLRENSGRPHAQVARDLGVGQVTLAAWESSYGSGGAGAGTRSAATSPGAGPAGTVTALAEAARFRKELEHMTLQRDILKKPWPLSARNRGAL